MQERPERLPLAEEEHQPHEREQGSEEHVKHGESVAPSCNVAGA